MDFAAQQVNHGHRPHRAGRGTAQGPVEGLLVIGTNNKDTARHLGPIPLETESRKSIFTPPLGASGPGGTFKGKERQEPFS